MGKKKKTDKHHRRPTSIGGSNSERNISIIPIKKHCAWHILFANMQATEIAREINEKYIDPDYVLLPFFLNGRGKEELLQILRKVTKGLDY